MKKLSPDTAVAAQASIGDNGEIVENTVRYNPVTKGWRLTLRVKVKDPKQTTEMRAALVSNDQPLSETGAISYLPMNNTSEYIDAMPLTDIEKRHCLRATSARFTPRWMANIVSFPVMMTRRWGQ